MSGQWEVVRGKNERRSKIPPQKIAENKAEKKNKKSKADKLNGVKIEEVLPKSQLRTLYSSNKAQPVNKETKQAEKPKSTQAKKPEKKQTSKGTQELPKSKKPKSIETALKSIDSQEFISVYSQSKKLIPDKPIVWLKDLASFLNLKVPIEIKESLFSNEKNDFPLSGLPSKIRATIEKAINEVGTNNARLYFDIVLTTMAIDISKGLPVIGYLVFLQYIALNDSKWLTESISKYTSLLSSYQNRSHVAKSILWSIGHVGFNDLKCGLIVFEDLMLPLFEMKNYSRFLIEYLIKLIDTHQNAQLTVDQYLLILGVIYNDTNKYFPYDLQEKLLENLPNLKSLLLKTKNEEKCGIYLEPFLKKIATVTDKRYENTLCDVVLDILTKDDTAVNSWQRIYAKNLVASTAVLNFINVNYDIVEPSVKKSLKDLLGRFSGANQELSSKKKKYNGLKDAINIITKLQEQKEVPKQRSTGFSCPLFFAKIFLFLSFAFISIGFISSISSPELQNCVAVAGAIRDRICNATDAGVTWIDNKLDENIPEHYKIVKETVQPYWILAKDLGKLLVNLFGEITQSSTNYVNEKYPVILTSIDNYAPGLIDNTKKICNNAYSESIRYYHYSIDFLRKEVFTGKLAPDNLRKAVIEAYLTTSAKAAEYYHWAYNKVYYTSVK